MNYKKIQKGSLTLERKKCAKHASIRQCSYAGARMRAHTLRPGLPGSFTVFTLVQILSWKEVLC